MTTMHELSSRSAAAVVVCVLATVVAADAVHAQPQGSAKASSAQASASQASSGNNTPNALQGFSQNRGQPIHIDAAKLEVRDKDKIATFTGDAKTGDVKVVQGDTIMRSKTLVVFYEREGGAAAPAGSGKAAPAPAATPGPGGSQQIRRLEARGSVIVTQNDQTVTGDSGIFDTKANTVTMLGNVILTQGKNVMHGQTLTVDLTTGVSRLENEKGRVNMVLFPEQKPGAPAGQGSSPGTGPNPAGKPMNLNGMGAGQER
jgi:lipopolysaccharide export system protein LptA